MPFLYDTYSVVLQCLCVTEVTFYSFIKAFWKSVIIESNSILPLSWLVAIGFKKLSWNSHVLECVPSAVFSKAHVSVSFLFSENLTGLNTLPSFQSLHKLWLNLMQFSIGSIGTL